MPSVRCASSKRCSPAWVRSPDRGRPALERLPGLQSRARCPRSDAPRPSVIPRPGCAPRTEGIPPSKGFRDSNRGQGALGPMRLVQALFPGLGALPGPSASRPRKASGTPIEGKMPSVRCASSKRCSAAWVRSPGPRASRPRKASGTPIGGKMPSVRCASSKRCSPAWVRSPDRVRPALERLPGLQSRARCPRSDAPRPSVVPRPGCAPRTEGIPPSKGFRDSNRGQDALGPMRLVQALFLGLGALPGPRASRPRSSC